MLDRLSPLSRGVLRAGAAAAVVCLAAALLILVYAGELCPESYLLWRLAAELYRAPLLAALLCMAVVLAKELG